MDIVCPKHVEFFTKIKLRNSASCWLLFYEYITMHGLQNVKLIGTSHFEFKRIPLIDFGDKTCVQKEKQKCHPLLCLQFAK